MLTGIINIAAKTIEMIESCRNEVMIALPNAEEKLIKKALPKLRSLHDRGAKITILISDKINKDHLTTISRFAKIKIKKDLFGGGVICDKRYVIILFGQMSNFDELIAIWADHTGLAGFAREYFEYLLKDSKEIKI